MTHVRDRLLRKRIAAGRKSVLVLGLFDVGVRNALLDAHRRAPSADQAGTVFEQWVALQVVYLSRALKKGWKLSSYRSEAGAEVDLVVERETDIVAIEIKYGRNVGKIDTRGLQSLREIAGGRKPMKTWILYGGDRRQKFDNDVDVWPVLEGLRALA